MAGVTTGRQAGFPQTALSFSLPSAGGRLFLTARRF